MKFEHIYEQHFDFVWSALRALEALSALDAIAREFPNGALAQEREALAIEALRVGGRSAEARLRATAFLARYPASPHAASVRHALE